ncbi:MAG: OmpH family outer membrane protein [Deltaproteobacteria bacterium]|nr:OmpH family outer membrane protein [Deltaproteobacteria bacterium]
MKKLQFSIIAVAFVAIFSSMAAAAELKLGVVNLQKALNECSAGKEAVTELEADVKKRQEQVDAKQEELKKLNEEMEKKTVIIKDMIEIVKKLAKERGYTFVFETQGGIVYNPSEADITDEVIKLYNAEYKKGKK